MASKMTVVVPTHRRPELLQRTLASLAECEKPEEYCETVVVENGTEAGDPAFLETAPSSLKARYLHVKRANKSHALNESLRTVDEGLVVFFDDDVRVDSGTLMRYSEAAKGRDGGTIYGGPFGVDYEREPPEWLKPYLPYSARGRSVNREWTLSPHDFDGFLGFNWAAFAEDIVSSGGFDEHFGPGAGTLGQETVMQETLLDAGVQARLVPGAKVWHYVPRERCSPAWLYGRQERAGRRMVRIQTAQQEGSDAMRTALAFMFADHAARVVKRAPLMWWQEATASSEHQRFRDRYYLQYHVGALREVWRQITSQTHLA